MITLAICALKGGVGKTAVTLALASAFHEAGHKVLVVDADPQASAALWAARAAERGSAGPPVVAMGGKALRRDLAGVANGFDLVVVDSPPRLSSDARSAMLVADLVVLPTGPGQADLWALQETCQALEEARALRPVRAGVVLNRVDRTVVAREARIVLEQLGMPLLGLLGSRVAHPEAFTAGQGVCSYAPASAAAFEIRRLVRTIIATLEAEEVAA